MYAHEMLAAQIELLLTCDRLLETIPPEHHAFDAIICDSQQARKRIARYAEMIQEGH